MQPHQSQSLSQRFQQYQASKTVLVRNGGKEA